MGQCVANAARAHQRTAEPPKNGGDLALDSWTSVDDRTLVHGLRVGRPEAVDEFIRRFEGLVLHSAERLRVPLRDRGNWAGDVLYEVATAVGRTNGPTPDHLAAYVVAACNLKEQHLPVHAQVS